MFSPKSKSLNIISIAHSSYYVAPVPTDTKISNSLTFKYNADLIGSTHLKASKIIFFARFNAHANFKTVTP